MDTCYAKKFAELSNKPRAKKSEAFDLKNTIQWDRRKIK